MNIKKSQMRKITIRTINSKTYLKSILTQTIFKRYLVSLKEQLQKLVFPERIKFDRKIGGFDPQF